MNFEIKSKRGFQSWKKHKTNNREKSGQQKKTVKRN
jgi:hypothetical protein